MKHVVVMSSSVSDAGRWDAEYHIAMNAYKEVVSGLRERFTIDEARQKLSEIPDSYKKSVLLLGAGERPKSQIPSICAKYPYESLAIISDEANGIVAAIEKRIEADKKFVGFINDLYPVTRRRDDGPSP